MNKPTCFAYNEEAAICGEEFPEFAVYFPAGWTVEDAREWLLEREWIEL